MEGIGMQKEDIFDLTLIRCGFVRLMRQEFAVYIGEEEREKIEQAWKYIQIFDTWEAFLEETGWAKDNPELCRREYLKQNHICREIHGKVCYFSHDQWEEWLSGFCD